MTTLEAMVEQCAECSKELEIGQIGTCEGCTEKTEFTFDELSDEAKTKARDKWRENSHRDEWWDCIYDDAVAVGKLIGIEIGQRYEGKNRRTGAAIFSPDISFSGFCSQGDGCCYSGDLNIKDLKGCVEKLKTHVGEGDTVLFELAAEGEALYNEVLRRLLVLRMQGVDVDDLNDNGDTTEVKLDSVITIEGKERYYRTTAVLVGCVSEVEDAMSAYVSGFADWIYKQLEAEDEHMDSDEYIDGEIEANDLLFDESGSTI